MYLADKTGTVKRAREEAVKLQQMAELLAAKDFKKGYDRTIYAGGVSTSTPLIYKVVQFIVRMLAKIGGNL